MKKLSVTTEKRVQETKELEIPEHTFRKSAMEVFEIDFRNEKPLIKGICTLKKDRLLRFELYLERDLEEILSFPEITEEEYNTTLQKAQEFLKMY